jgi:DNA-binding LacI/PurR family transcriptional regulator
LGHREIAYVDTAEMFEHEFRLQGYQDAMRELQLKPQVSSITGDYIESAGAQAAEKFIHDGELPTAIVCANDQAALGLVYTFQKNGVKVPEDISVVGYDDTIARLPFLDFTSVHQDAQELAQAAVADLAERISGKKKLAELYLTSANLVIRSSTSKPRLT